ncbi:proton-coupled amino acid transporter-like protein CG1139 [Bacillus rossius redtenbacheri]|uniref:proton-coupled amino acid transporter-like protein CG1139 n=1 Tax=Bacillus rossius redtenbacheri TaxID=93214 RepID=UPI002FDE91BF
MSHTNLGFTGSHGQGIQQLDLEEAGRKSGTEMKTRGTPLAAVNEKSEKVSPLSGVFVPDVKELKKKQMDDYDPHLDRQLENPTNNTETLLHLLKGSLGTGILAMPNAFYHSGYVLGVVGTIFIAFVCTYCIHMLVKCGYELSKRKRVSKLSFPDTAQAAFMEGPGVFQKIAPYAGHVVNVFLLIYQLGTCCVYVVFISTNLQQVFEEYSLKLDVRIFMVIMLLPLILINWVRNLKLLAPLSAVANVIQFVSFGIILYFIARNMHGLDDIEQFGELSQIPLFIGTVLFALEAVGMILPLENNMKTPKSFGGTFGILNIAMSVIIALYVGVGLSGYITYGKFAEGSITLNLPKGDKLAQSVKVLLSAAIFVSHALQCYIAVEIAWGHYLLPRLEGHKHRTFIEYVVRCSLVLVTFLLAVAIPNLELFISLFGALCLSALGIVAPAIIETATFWYSRDRSHFVGMLVKNLLILVFGLFALVIGTYTALVEIVKKLS